MIKKHVRIAKWKMEPWGFEYVITTANGHGLATMCQKSHGGLENATMIKNAINAQLDKKFELARDKSKV